MGIMVCSLLRVMQDLYHQPYLQWKGLPREGGADDSSVIVYSKNPESMVLAGEPAGRAMTWGAGIVRKTTTGEV